MKIRRVQIFTHIGVTLNCALEIVSVKTDKSKQAAALSYRINVFLTCVPSIAEASFPALIKVLNGVCKIDTAVDKARIGVDS